MSETIDGTIDRFAERMVVIKTEHNEELFWPIKNLPTELTVGARIKLTLSTTENGVAEKEVLASHSRERSGLAKKMLNDILHVEPTRDDR